MSELRQRIQGRDPETSPSPVFMKGTPEFVMCGNSDRALRARLRESRALPSRGVDVLRRPGDPAGAVPSSPAGRRFRRVFVKGELIGGADITEELAASGELTRVLEEKLGPDYRGLGPVSALYLS